LDKKARALRFGIKKFIKTDKHVVTVKEVTPSPEGYRKVFEQSINIFSGSCNE